MTYTANAGTDRKTTVWSHNTSYTGAVGRHNECGRGTRAREVILKNDCSSAMSSMNNLHKKEIRQLQNSMLAYTEKMRQLSLDKLPSETIKSRQRNGGKAEGVRETTTLSRVAEASASSTKSSTRSPLNSPSPDSLSDDVIPTPGTLSRFPSLDNVSGVTSVSTSTSKSRLSVDSAFVSSRSPRASGFRQEASSLSSGRSPRNRKPTPSPGRPCFQFFDDSPGRKHSNGSHSLYIGLEPILGEDAEDFCLSGVNETAPDSGRCSHGSSHPADDMRPILEDAMEIIAHPERLVPPLVLEESESEWSDSSIGSYMTHGKRQRRTKTKSRRRNSQDDSAREDARYKTHLPSVFKRRKRGSKQLNTTCVRRRLGYTDAVASSVIKMGASSSGADRKGREGDSCVLNSLALEDLDEVGASWNLQEEDSVDKYSYSAFERCKGVSPRGSPRPDSDSRSDKKIGNGLSHKSVVRKADKKSVHFVLNDSPQD